MTVDTINETEDVLAAMQGMLHRAPEPGGLQPGEVINAASGNEELPVNMIASSVSSAGHVYVWDRKTGERSAVNMNMLPAQLKKQGPDGKPVFTIQKPNFEPRRGTLCCLLHRDDPNRALYDQFGLPECRKSNLTSPYMVEQHMAHRHKNEWATIQRERAEDEKRQERARLEQHQRDLVAAMAGRVAMSEPAEPRTRGRKAAEGAA